MFNWHRKRRREPADHVNAAIIGVAIQIDEVKQFRVAAAEVASNIGPGAIELMAELFHSAPEPPDGFGSEIRGLGGWLSAWQFAIFEIYFNFGENSLPVLRKVAYGEYDWTQANAIEVLCRLAANGIKRDSIIDELKREFPRLRHESQLYVVQPLLLQVKENPGLATVLNELSTVEEFRETIDELMEERVDEDPENVTEVNLHGVVTRVELKVELESNRKIIGIITVAGLNYFSFDECGGNARLGVTEQTRLLRLTNGTFQSIQLADISANDRVALGSYSVTVQTNPVTIYPECITKL